MSEHNRIKKLDILSKEIERQYNETRESHSKITNSCIILTAINLYTLINLFNTSNQYAPYICFLILITLYYAYKCLSIKSLPIGVDIDELAKGIDKSELELKETVVANLKDCLEEQREYSLEKAKYYTRLLLISILIFALYTLLIFSNLK